MEYFDPEMLVLVGGFLKAVGSGLKSAFKSFGGSIIQGAASLLGGAQTASGVRATNRAQMRLAREQMDFQERMSSTAYQRAAEDLEAAGLNRILALGSPATSPHGAMAMLQNPDAPIGEAIANAPSSAQAIRRQQAEIGNIRQMAKTGASQERLNEKDLQVRDETIKQINATIENIKAQTKNTTAMNAKHAAEEAFYRALGPAVVAVEKFMGRIGLGGLVKLPGKGPTPKAPIKGDKVPRASERKRPLPKDVRDIIRQYE